MKTTYLAWKNPTCNGVNPEWQELTGQEFLTFIRLDENKNRRFIKLYSAIEDGSDGDIMIEATAEEYKKWRKDKDHSDWVRKGNAEKGYQTVSYHAMEAEDGCFGEELLRDEDCDVEADCFKGFEIETVRTAVASLSEDERKIVEYFLFPEKPGSERDYAKLAGITKSTVNRQKIAVIEKLKKILKKSGANDGWTSQ